MAENLYDMIKNNQKKEYPIANQKKDFIELLQKASQWREKNNNEVKKEAFIEMSTNGKLLAIRFLITVSLMVLLFLIVYLKIVLSMIVHFLVALQDQLNLMNVILETVILLLQK